MLDRVFVYNLLGQIADFAVNCEWGKDKSNMNIMIVGGGLLGRKTAEMLDEAGHDVVLIDASQENLAQLSPDFSGVTAVGFPMDIKSLRSAGIEGCDAVAVTTPDDNLNITVGQIAKNVFGIPKVVARISDPYRENIFESFGLQTVCPTNMAGDKLVTALTSPWQSRQITFGTATVSLVVLPVEHRCYGHTTGSVELRPGEGLFGVIKEDGQFLLKSLREEIPLEQGDYLVCSRKID